jgi:hypothetical protein
MRFSWVQAVSEQEVTTGNVDKLRRMGKESRWNISWRRSDGKSKSTFRIGTTVITKCGNGIE